MRHALRILSLLLSAIILNGCSLFEVHENDKILFKQHLQDLAVCYGSKLINHKMPSEPLYTSSEGLCLAVNTDLLTDGDYYTNQRCEGEQVYFRDTDENAFCEEMSAPYRDRLGNAAVSMREPSYWTLYPSLKVGISVLSIKDNHQPFMTRARYKSVQVREQHQVAGANGESATITTLQGVGQCDLEMRIYKRSPQATGLKPLLALHGGAWAHRGSAFIGFESEISHLTERGFVVFTPFYRLVNSHDGNYECNRSDWRSIVSDAEDALQWVRENGSDYGAGSAKISLLGGSAGGHLAGWLTVNHPEQVERSLLFYPPTDFVDYIQLALQSESELKGEKVIETFLGLDGISEASLNDEGVQATTFPQQVVADPGRYPPVSIIHGVSDTLVPSTQSVRLCNGLNGDLEDGPARNDGGTPADGTYMKEYPCGDDGTLYLIAEGEHGLDACIEHLSCATGSRGSQAATREVMTRAFDWLAR